MTPKIFKENTRIFPIHIYALFGFFFFTIIYFLYKPELMYFRLQPFFINDINFFKNFENLHHGNLIIISNFFAQFLAYRIAGAIMLTLFLLLLSFFIRQLFRNPFAGLEFIPSLIILHSFKTYNHGIEALILFMLVTFLAYLFNLLAGKRIILKIFFHTAIITGTYFIFGSSFSFAYLIIYICSDMTDFHIRNLYGQGISTIAFILLTFGVTGAGMLRPILKTLHASDPKALIPQYWPVLAFCMVLSAGLLILSKIKERNNFLHSKTAFFLSPVIILIIIIALSGKLFTFQKKYNTEIEYYAFMGEWEKVFSYRNEVALDDRISLFHLNRAMFHTNRLENKLFSIRQHWGVNTLFLTMNYNRACTINSSDLFYDMGFIKGSKYWALEAQTYNSYSPRILQRLANISILLDDTTGTEKYLSILEKSIVYRHWVRDLRRQLARSSGKAIRDQWFGSRQTDYNIFFINNQKPNLDLIQILKKDPGNKMAFEYLMAYYLLSNELGNFIFYLKEYGPLYFTSLPEIYQQALLIYSANTKNSEILQEFTISESVHNEMNEFSKILYEYRLDIGKARKDLHRNFGNTYWYYIRYVSPETIGSDVKKKKI